MHITKIEEKTMTPVVSVRLTTSARETVTRQMIEFRFSKEATALAKDYAALARAVYDDVYKPKDRRLMESLPNGWLPTANELKVSFSGSVATVWFSGRPNWRSVLGTIGVELADTNLPVAAKHAHGVAAVYDANHKLAVRYAQLHQRLADLRARHDATRSQVVAAVDKATTTGALKKMWPEAARFCKEIEKNAGISNLPALPTSQLNEMLGLKAA